MRCRPGRIVIELFVERVSDYRATVHRTTAVDLPAAIAAVLAAHGATRIAVPAGIPDSLARRIERGRASPTSRVLSHADLERWMGS